MLQRQITARMIDDHLMQAAIVANPHREKDDQEEFVQNLVKQRRWYRGIDDDESSDKPDFAALNALKDKMKKESYLVKAK